MTAILFVIGVAILWIRAMDRDLAGRDPAVPLPLALRRARRRRGPKT